MENAKYDDFRELEVWNKCRDIRRKIWDVCKAFPGDENTDCLIR